ncbi:hypothetical protein CIG75_17230 [Tumebacillus algifaecis]|uniref:Uncharacterized protein n=1 Tax=Tumebacillus algifaecis TaxID=1214604 RepID=A0A223D4H5_9BACL|nr:GerAB/ArcD/ProY family transporter [Tumebacillus algifaecis]ASS76529.1 hypothetical protein CIG75_17230 [Tumebacillus algifaecis]
MNNQVYQYRVLFFVIHLGSVFLLFPEMILLLGRTPWLPILFGMIIQLLLLWLYLSGLRAFPGQNLIDIFLSKGKWFARLLLLPYIVYLFNGNFIFIRSYAEMMTITMFKQTPIWALAVLLLIIPLYMASKGLSTILRTTMLLSMLFLPMLLATIIASAQNIDIRNAFPIGEFSLQFLGSINFISLFFVFSPFLILGMLNHNEKVLTENKRPAMYYLISGAVALFCLIAVYIPILSFGLEMNQRLQYSMLIAIDAVDLEWFVFDRITVFYVSSLLAFVFIYLAIQCWIFTQLVSKLFLPRLKPSLITWSFGLVTLVGTVLIPTWEWVFKAVRLDTPFRFYSMVLIPLLIKGMSLRKGRSIQ